MDITFEKYMEVPVGESAKRIIAFIEKNDRNCIFSVLWHNMSFTRFQFKEYLKEYKTLLAYCYEKGLRSITPEEIVKRYGWNRGAKTTSYEPNSA
ncbi:MAG: hypothetical protein R3307_08855 [Anaerolineales bacterium]|nr:hypothetical protein [Anaerolineales bacterium]